MSKVIVAAAVLVGAAVAVVATGGAALGVIATSLTSTAAFGAAGTAFAWATVAAVTWSLGVVGSAINKPASQANNGANQTQVKLAGGRAPRPIVFGRTGTAGYITYRNTFGTKNTFLAVLTLLSAGGPIAGIDSYIMGDGYTANFNVSPGTGLAHVTSLSPAPSGKDGSKLYVNNTQMLYRYGKTPEDVSWSTASGTPMPGMDTNFKTSGYAGALGIYSYDNAVFPAGYPKGLWVVRGVKCWDARKDSTWPGGSGSHRLNDPTTWEYSENPYVCALNFILGRYENGRKVWGLGVPAASLADQVDVPAFINGANVADANGWKVGGSVETSDDKFAVLGAILQAGGGQAVARGAQLSVVVNAPKASVATITTADIVGDISITSGSALKDTHNVILPSYREESQRWQVISGERIGIPSWITEDGGEEHSVEVNYSLVQNAAQAHQLAAYDICNSRDAGFRATVVCGPRFLTVRVGDCLTLNVPQLGAASQKCLVVERSFDPASLQVTLTLQAESDSKHGYALGQSQTAPASPSLSSYDPSNPDAPSSGAWSITSTAITTSTGVSVPALVVTGANDDVNTRSIIAEYRPYGSSVWLAAQTVSKDATTIEIVPVTAGTSYEVAISYLTVRGVVGARLVLGPATAGAQVFDYGGSAATGVVNLPTGLTVDTNGYLSAGGVKTSSGVTVETALSQASGGNYDSTPPAIPTSLTLSSSLNGDQTSKLTATWTPPGDADLQSYEVGIATNGGGEVQTGVASATYSVNLPAATPVVVRVRALDRSGNRSGWTSTVSTTTVSDTTAPGPPQTPNASGGYGSDWLGWLNDTAPDLVAVEVWANSTNDLSTATQRSVVYAQPGAQGRFSRSNVPTGTITYWWLRSVDRSGNKSAFTASFSDTIGGIGAGDLANGAVTTAAFAASIKPIELFASDAAAGTPTTGRVYYSTTDSKLHRANGSAWTVAVDGADLIANSISTGVLKAGVVSTTELASGSITASKLAVTNPSLFRDPLAQDAKLWQSITYAGNVYPIDNATTGWYRETSTNVGSYVGSTSGLVLWAGRSGQNNLNTNRFHAYQYADTSSVQSAIQTMNSISGGKQLAFGATINNSTNKNIYLQIDIYNNDLSYSRSLNVGCPPSNRQNLIAKFNAANSETLCRFVAYNNAQSSDANLSGVAVVSNIFLKEAAPAELIVDGSITTTQLTVDATMANTIVSNITSTNVLNANVIKAGTGLDSTITVGQSGVTLGTVQSQANDPATRINAQTTKIDPGKITISGSTLLSDWRNAGDTTKIEGGSIAANTITANKLTIGNRAINFPQLSFQVVNSKTALQWGAYYVQYVDDSGVQQQLSCDTSGQTFTGTAGHYYYFYWTQGATGLAVTENPAFARADNAVCVATWQCGTTLVVANYGGTVIDGDRITTGTVTAAKLNVTDLSAISANLGTITVGSANIGDLQVGTTKIADQAVSQVIVLSAPGPWTYSPT